MKKKTATFFILIKDLLSLRLNIPAKWIKWCTSSLCKNRKKKEMRKLSAYGFSLKFFAFSIYYHGNIVVCVYRYKFCIDQQICTLLPITTFSTRFCPYNNTCTFHWEFTILLTSPLAPSPLVQPFFLTVYLYFRSLCFLCLHYYNHCLYMFHVSCRCISKCLIMLVWLFLPLLLHYAAACHPSVAHHILLNRKCAIISCWNRDERNKWRKKK